MTVKLVLPLLLFLLSFIMAGGAVRLAGPGQARPLDFATKIHSFGRSVSRSLGLNRRGASFTLLHDTTQHTVLLCYMPHLAHCVTMLHATPGTLCYIVTLPDVHLCPVTIHLLYCTLSTHVHMTYIYTMAHCHITCVTTQCTLSINPHTVHQTPIYMFAIHRSPLIFAEPLTINCDSKCLVAV